MKLKLGLCFAMLLFTGACSDDEPKEPVAAEQKVPDNPGESGEAKPADAKPADAAQPAPAAAPEKSTPPPMAAPAAAAVGDMVVKPGALNVRSGPGTKNSVLRTLKKGEHVTPSKCDAGWCQIGDGQYVSEKYLTHSR